MRDNDWSDDEDDWLETGAEDELARIIHKRRSID
jgi:hypothetical protein